MKGEFWNAPPPVHWTFPPTADFDPGAVAATACCGRSASCPGRSSRPHPPVYAPFSYSMETSKFWAREGGKMVSFVAPEREDFIRLALDIFLEEADRAGRTVTPADALALGAHLTMGRTPAGAGRPLPGLRGALQLGLQRPAVRRARWGGSSAGVGSRSSTTSAGSTSASVSASSSSGTTSATSSPTRSSPCSTSSPKGSSSRSEADRFEAPPMTTVPAADQTVVVDVEIAPVRSASRSVAAAPWWPSCVCPPSPGRTDAIGGRRRARHGRSAASGPGPSSTPPAR